MADKYLGNAGVLRKDKVTWWQWDLPRDWVPIVQANLCHSTLSAREDF